MERELLFGGALFAAGFVAGASAQVMTLTQSYVDIGALDYTIPAVMFDGFAGAGPFGPLSVTAGASYAYAVGTGTQLLAWGSCPASPAMAAQSGMLCEFTVPTSGLNAQISWDWSGSLASGPWMNSILFENLTAGTTLLDVDYTAGGAQTGAVGVPLDAGVVYRWTAVASATQNLTGPSFVSLEYGGCPCDLDGNMLLGVDDVDAFVAAFVAGNLAADLDNNGVVNTDDIDAFVACFTGGCA